MLQSLLELPTIVIALAVVVHVPLSMPAMDLQISMGFCLLKVRID
tara:strand:+ start:293 stop:427 length:135 start_codon:yes stop_codon:yes gene_type:complete